MKYSRTGKPLCSTCRKTATHEIHAINRTPDRDGQVFYSYQCVQHRHTSSKLLTAAHIDALSLDQSFYHRHLFSAWLAEHKDMTVGCTADEKYCPLAFFYSLYYQKSCIVAFEGQVLSRDGAFHYVHCCLPAWAKKFVLALDFTHPDILVTGQQALDLLEHMRQSAKDKCLLEVARPLSDDDQALRAAWQSLQSVPSYVETQARLFVQEKSTDRNVPALLSAIES